MDASFDEDFTSPVVLPNLLFSGALRLRNTTTHIPNQDIDVEMTGISTTPEEIYPDDMSLPQPENEDEEQQENYDSQ